MGYICNVVQLVTVHAPGLHPGPEVAIVDIKAKSVVGIG